MEKSKKDKDIRELVISNQNPKSKDKIYIRQLLHEFICVNDIDFTQDGEVYFSGIKVKDCIKNYEKTFNHSLKDAALIQIESYGYEDYGGDAYIDTSCYSYTLETDGEYEVRQLKLKQQEESRKKQSATAKANAAKRKIQKAKEEKELYLKLKEKYEGKGT